MCAPKRHKRSRKLRRAVQVDRALRHQMALERMRDLLLGRALRKLREPRRFKRLGESCWSDYVADRLGCELRWTQYLVRLDVVLDTAFVDEVHDDADQQAGSDGEKKNMQTIHGPIMSNGAIVAYSA